MRGSAAPSLQRARHALIESGQLPVGLMDTRLARSWQRSLACGLSPLGRLPEMPHLSGSEMRHAKGLHHELIANARPVMEHLFSQVRDADNMVILADPQGVLLDTLGEGDFVSRAERVTLKPGASWGEACRGTNAIGTALTDNTWLEIHGAEHFLDGNSFLTCAAAPVFAPDFSLLGALDISGDRRQRHPHTLGLVRTATQMIENRIFLSRHQRGIYLQLHPLAEGLGTVVEGLLALSEEGRIIGANRTALQMLGLQAIDLGVMSISQVLKGDHASLIAWGRRSIQDVHQLTSVRGTHLFVRPVVGNLPPLSARTPAFSTTRRTRELHLPGDELEKLNTGDPALALAIDRGRRVLGKAIPLLLHGESGVGKELFACALHASGPRREKPFVAVNCAALPEHLIEAELFGYAAGAFTGASREGKPGRLREAHGGTLFLDEIGDMPISLQSRLLRVLQERQVSPLGGGKAQAVDFALICATHRRLKDEVAAGRFRADLYYRLNGLSLALPALRDRSDFETLTRRLLSELSPEVPLILSPDVARAFSTYGWPGNLRQLANALRTASALLDPDEQCIDWCHLPEDLAEELLRPDVPCRTVECTVENLRMLSRSAMDRVIGAADGNLSEAARRLGISRNTLYRRLKQDAETLGQ